MSLKVLVLVAHTDDETLGMGGTINKHFLKGDKIYVLSMTDGISSRSDNCSQKYLRDRFQAAKEASEILGFKWFEFGNFPDNSMDSVPLLEIIKFIEKAKNKLNPDIIYTHSAADLNIDHKIVNHATLTAFRPQCNENWKEIRTFEIPSSTEWGDSLQPPYYQPNLWIDITKNWSNKLASLHKYDMEMREYPHPRSYEGVENLAKFRGNQVGIQYAESFQIIKKIVR